MKYVAYHRTSTKDQHLDRGIAELTKYCADNAISLYKGKVYTDQQTGKNFNRPRYTMLKDEILESGDVLIVTELDRLGRNKEATLKELRFFKDNGIRVMVLELPTTLIDLSAMENSMARMMLETINKAKAEGLEELPIIPLHGLRHSCATLLNYLEVNIIEISKTLGHSTCSTTMNIYAHSFEEQQEEVATKVNEFLRLNA